MSDSADDDSTPDSGTTRNRSRLRFELIFGSVWLAIGLFLMPAIIYMVGTMLLGVYREGSGLGRFYVDFFGDLAEPSGRAWTIALGPLLLITMLRAVFIGVRPPESDDAAQKPIARPRSEPTRVEPRVGLD